MRAFIAAMTLVALAVLVASDTGPAQPVPIALLTASDAWGRPSIIVYYRGTPLRLMVDTGAGGSILRPSAWEALGRPGAGPEAWVDDWKGTRYLVANPQLDGLVVGSCTLNDVDMMVADASLGPDTPGGYSGLAGVPLLRRLGSLSIDLNAAQVTTADCG